MSFANIGNVDDNVMTGGGLGYGMGGGTGAWSMIIVVIVIMWLLFKDGSHGHDGGHGYGPGYGFGGGCGMPVQPTFKDESNFEEERNINSKLCCIDKDIWNTDKDVVMTACETQKEIVCDGQKTRSLIEANYIQDLRDKLVEKNDMIMTMKQEMFTEKKIDQVLGAINCTNQRIGALECELPKRPPVYCETITPNTHHVDCDRDYGRGYGYNNAPKRGNCDSCGDGFGNNYGYAY